MSRQSFLLAGATPLHGEVDLPSRPGPRPTVVICHGFKGFFEWGFFPPLATLLAERGLTVVRFNYSGSGMRPGDALVSDLGAFRRNTHSLELSETLRVLDALGTEIAPGRVDRARIGLLGHSRGGGAAILASADRGWRERLGALVTWAAVSSFDRYADAEGKRFWRERGALPIKNARTGQDLELGVELLDDLEAHGEALDVLTAAQRRTAPWLIVHGAADESVPVAEANRLDTAAAGRHELKLVPAASHTFGATHPFAGPTPELITAMNATQTWFRRHLGAE